MTTQKPNQPAQSAQPATNLFTKRLRQMQTAWDNSKEESKKGGGNFEILLEDGRYTARLSRAELKDTGEKFGVVMDFVVVDGNPEAIGQSAGRWSGLDDPDKLIYLQRDFRRMGVDVDNMSIEQLPDLLAELVQNAPTVRITIKTNQANGYKNVYIDKLVDFAPLAEGNAEIETEPAAEEPAAEATGTAEEDAGTEVEGDEAVTGDDEPANTEGSTLEIGMKVSYTNPMSKKKGTGIVAAIDPDDGTLDIKDDKSKKLVRGLNPDGIEELAEVG